MAPEWSKIEPKCVKQSEKTVQKSKATKKAIAFHSIASFWPKKWPTWPQVGRESSEIDTLIDLGSFSIFDASWGRFLKGFWWILESKMEPSWYQNRSKIDANCEMQFFEKSCSGCSLSSIFVILGVEVESKNRLKIDEKTESKMDGILASIFLGFWSIFGSKLGGKMEPRSTQKGIEKRCKKQQKPDCQKSRNKNPSRLAPPRILGLGGGRGRDKSLPEGRGKWMIPVQSSKLPQPRGLVGF